MESVIIKESNTNGLTSNAGNKNNPSTQWMGLGTGGRIPAGILRAAIKRPRTLYPSDT